MSLARGVDQRDGRGSNSPTGAYRASWFVVLCLGTAALLGCQPSPKPAVTPSSAALVNIPLALPEGFREVDETVAGRKVHYVIGGSGPMIVLLHGWPGSWYSWHLLAPLLVKEHTVVAFDMPAFGDSDVPAATDETSIAQTLWAIIERLAPNGVDIVGHDMGFLPAYAIAAMHPDRVRHLVAVDTALPGFQLATGDAQDLLLPTKQRNLWYIPFFMAVDDAVALCEGKEDVLLTRVALPSFFDRAKFTSVIQNEEVRGMRLRGHLKGQFSYYRSWFDDAKQNHAFALKRLTLPVLTVAGAASPLQYVIAASIAPVALHLESTVIPKSGHFIAEEQPEALRDVILEFLKR